VGVSIPPSSTSAPAMPTLEEEDVQFVSHACHGLSEPGRTELNSAASVERGTLTLCNLKHLFVELEVEA